jgi:hypothetical protein
MPAIFGAFGNFLLPTQLGVHDVAFPRLNSAAFWFLPGGLIMLCHLVCTDRRYARMNCFNIRELQSILKRKFFTDLVNTHDHRDLLEQSMIGLRYKSNNSLNLNSDILSFYNFGISTTNLNKLLLFTNSSSNSSVKNLKNYDYFFINFFNSKSNFFSLSPLSFYINTICEYFSLLLSFSIFNLPFFNINSLGATLLTNINFYVDFSYLTYLYNSSNFSVNSTNKKSFLVQDAANNSNSIKNTLMESSADTRYARFFNVLVNYDYKTGHYVGNWEQQYPFLYTTFIEVARGIRKPS